MHPHLFNFTILTTVTMSSPSTKPTKAARKQSPIIRNVPRAPVPSPTHQLTHPLQYLLLYNTINLLTWTTVLILTLTSLYNLLTTPSNPQSKLRPYTTLGPFLKYTETFTLLEVLHVILNLVQTSLTPTLIQAYGRTWTVWGVLDAFESGKSSYAFTGLALAWSLSEIVRYSFYISNLLQEGGKPPGGIQWLRYNLFIVLYPLGAGSEWWLMYRCLGEAREWNTGYWGWMVFSMAVYPICKCSSLGGD